MNEIRQTDIIPFVGDCYNINNGLFIGSCTKRPLPVLDVNISENRMDLVVGLSGLIDQGILAGSDVTHVVLGVEVEVPIGEDSTLPVSTVSNMLKGDHNPVKSAYALTVNGTLLRGVTPTCPTTKLSPKASPVQALTLAPIAYVTEWAKLTDTSTQAPNVLCGQVSLATTIASCKAEFEELQQALGKVRFCVTNHDWNTIVEFGKFFGDLEVEYYKTVESCLEGKPERTLATLREGLDMLVEGTDILLSCLEKLQEDARALRMRYCRKANLLKVLLEEGVEYCGARSCLLDVLRDDQDFNYLVLFIKESFCPKDVLNSINSLLEMKQQRRKDRGYVVVDLDTYDSDLLDLQVPDKPVICHYRGGWLSTDVVGDAHLQIGKANIVLYDSESCMAVPARVGHLVMRCPGSYQGMCPPSKVPWVCACCCRLVEYGFDDKLYCDCGCVNVADTKFLCSDYGHTEPVSFLSQRDLKTQLLGVQPLEELNVLLIGQSGVGKSTWINGIVNYLSFTTLDEAAKSKELLWVVPSQFTLYDEDNVTGFQIKVGSDENESHTIGDSATQACKTYIIVTAGHLVRLIDTPGMGDTRGYEQDCENISHIVRHLMNFDRVHGICFLLKPNEPRINASFTYCIKELFCYLDKNAQSNLVFCFTNVRSTEYKPGSSLSLLKQVLADAECHLRVDYRNIYCLDNESYRFLCAIKKTTMTFPDQDRESYADSWNRSVDETHRLFAHLTKLPSHEVRPLLGIATLRHKMSMVTDSLREAAAASGSTAIPKYQADIKIYEDKITALRSDLYVKKLSLTKEKNLGSSGNVVCSNASCTEAYGGEVYHKTICCAGCTASAAFDVLVNADLLANCHILKPSVCSVCKCRWEQHMIINYTEKKMDVEEEDPAIRKQIDDVQVLITEVQSKLAKVRKAAMHGKDDEQKLLAFGVRLSSYMAENAMILYNDDLKKYLSYLIGSEEAKPNKTAEDRAKLKAMAALKLKCEDEDRIAEEMKAAREGSGRSSLIDICNEEMDLKNLPCYKQKPCTYEVAGPVVEMRVRLKPPGLDVEF